MTDEFRYFRNVLTGRVALFPVRFGDRPLLEEVPSEDASCIDCALPETDDHTHDDEIVYLGEDFSQEHPDNGEDDLSDDLTGEDD